jgi:NADH-quinone oxidoreductase subunit G
MLAMALRQAHRRGASVTVIDPRPVELPFAFTHIAYPPDTLEPALAWLCRESVPAATAASLDPPAQALHRTLDTDHTPFAEALAPVAEDLRERRRPVLVCGTALGGEDLTAFAADAVRLWRAAGQSAGLFCVLNRAGAFGAALLGGPSWEDIVRGIENDEVHALLVVETDPLEAFPDRRRMEAALDRLDLLVVMDYLETAVGARAALRLPAPAVYESGGHFANQEGRLQAVPAVVGGASVLQTGGGSHPPRAYDAPVPGRGRPATWQALAILGGPHGSAADPLAYLAEAVPGLSRLASSEASSEEGRALLRSTAAPQPPDPGRTDRTAPQEGLQLVLTDWTFGTEPLSVRSACLEKVTPAPWVGLHPAEAQPLGLADGDRAILATEAGALTVAVRVDHRVAVGVLVLPRHHRLAWQIFPSDEAWLGRDRITPAAPAQAKEDTL